jgi:hypothetical protein
MQTSNSGTNWVSLGSIGTGNFGGITGTGIPLENSFPFVYLWYVRSSPSIYFSIAGTGWVSEYTASAGTYRHITPVNISTGFWAVRTNGGISYHVPITGVPIISSEIPDKFSLYQNYPNPFNPVTKIKFEVPQSLPPFTKGGQGEFITLKVYDILGREVAVLVNEQLKPGTYEIEWDGMKYPSGVYFYMLTTNEFTETKKMMLLK